jgi:hypothetical protein
VPRRAEKRGEKGALKQEKNKKTAINGRFLRKEEPPAFSQAARSRLTRTLSRTNNRVGRGICQRTGKMSLNHLIDNVAYIKRFNEMEGALRGQGMKALTINDLHAFIISMLEKYLERRLSCLQVTPT